MYKILLTLSRGCPMNLLRSTSQNIMHKKIALVSSLFLLLSACSYPMTKTYSGPDKPRSDIAVLWVHNAKLLSVDDKVINEFDTWAHYSVLPGKHRIKAEFSGGLSTETHVGKTTSPVINEFTGEFKAQHCYMLVARLRELRNGQHAQDSDKVTIKPRSGSSTNARVGITIGLEEPDYRAARNRCAKVFHGVFTMK